MAVAPAALAAELVVRIGGLAAPLGSVGCSLLLRAPRFEEAAFTIPADAAEWLVEIRVAS